MKAVTEKLIPWLHWHVYPCDLDALRALKACVLRKRTFPEMTTSDEQKFFEESARAVAIADGAIVDLGCWMCSTSIALARGAANVRARRRSDSNKIHAFDIFVWESWMDANLPFVSCEYQTGDSFLPEVRRRISPYVGAIELHREDLTQYVWQSGPIKLLLVDAMKNWTLARSIATSFLPYLAKGSILIHQDFNHFFTPWIQVLQYRLREFFRFRREVEKGWTVAFDTLAEIPYEVVSSAADFDRVSDAEFEAAIQYSMNLVSAHGRIAIAAAHVAYFVHKGRAGKAREVCNAYCAAGVPVIGEFASAVNFLTAAEQAGA
jgi:hypothetical protein